MGCAATRRAAPAARPSNPTPKKTAVHFSLFIFTSPVFRQAHPTRWPCPTRSGCPHVRLSTECLTFLGVSTSSRGGRGWEEGRKREGRGGEERSVEPALAELPTCACPRACPRERETCACPSRTRPRGCRVLLVVLLGYCRGLTVTRTQTSGTRTSSTFAATQRATRSSTSTPSSRTSNRARSAR